MRSIHLPMWLGAVGDRQAARFATLFTISTLGRATLITLLPLQAHAHLGDAQKVSILYFGIAGGGLLISLSIAWLVGVIRRRRVLTIGALAQILAAFLFSLNDLETFVIGMMMQAFAIACQDITLNLYVMDHIPRRELKNFEPLRLFFAGGSWSIGPLLGVYLAEKVAGWAPYALVAVIACSMIGYFWFLRIQEDPAVAPAKEPPKNPLRYLGRFFRQPRLRLAWVLAVGRAGWWSMFFIYAPIYVVDSGFSQVVSGAVVSVGSASLFIVPLWGWVGRRYGLRRLLMAGYLLAGLVTLGVAAAAGLPWLGISLLVLAALSASLVDGAGNVPFMRAVHPHERPEMTAVFGTYRDTAQLAPPGVFTLLLKLFALPAVFVGAGCAMLILSYVARYIPKRL